LFSRGVMAFIIGVAALPKATAIEHNYVLFWPVGRRVPRRVIGTFFQLKPHDITSRTKGFSGQTGQLPHHRMASIAAC
ncbi:hypothetical protein, partial [Erwinia amylovora]|uniref:hypothetical protein n=1 Tax=Erwinia amylovora TaxID=552 RepID=UPI0020C105D5